MSYAVKEASLSLQGEGKPAVERPPLQTHKLVRLP